MPTSPQPPVLRAAVLTAVLAAAAGLGVAVVLTVLAQLSGGFGSPLSIARTAGRAWLVANGSGLSLGDVSFTAVPLGATVAAVAVVSLATRWVLAGPLGDDTPTFVAGTAGAYGVIAAVLSAVVALGDGSAGLLRSGLAAFVVGGLGAGWSAFVRHRDAGTPLVVGHEDVGPVLRAGLRGAAVVVVAATVVVVALLVAHAGRAADLWAGLDPGASGGFVLLVGCLAVAPNLVLWAVSAILGPGFALGSSTSVDLTGSHLGDVPALPLLAALPDPGPFPDLVVVLALVPVLAGLVAGWSVLVDAGATVGRHVLTGTAAGAVGGVVVGLLVACSGGAVGPGRLQDAGPPLFTPLLVAVATMAVGGALGSAVAHYRGGRAEHDPAAD